jgi:hypothetical protein
MKIYVFGNQDEERDKMAIEVANRIEELLLTPSSSLFQKEGVKEKIHFIYVKPNEDLPFVGEEEVMIMDVVMGIDKPVLIEGEDVDKLVLGPRVTAHDFDLGWQIKYLKKLGKLGSVRIVGLPYDKEVNIDEVTKLITKCVDQVKT